MQVANMLCSIFNTGLGAGKVSDQYQINFRAGHQVTYFKLCFDLGLVADNFRAG
jgi:hypothetical protein